MEVHPRFKGAVIYDIDGNPVCALCEKSFSSLGTHITSRHKISVAEYKSLCELPKKVSLISANSKRKRQKRAAEYSAIVMENLKKGWANKFKPKKSGV